MKTNPLVTKEILLQMAKTGAILTALTVSPALFTAALAYTQYKEIAKKDAQNTFYYMKRKGWISAKSTQSGISIAITRKGKKHIAKTSILNVGPLSSKKWDKNWRIVTYDIQVKKSEERNAIRLLLKRLGFKQMHRSVWVSPHDCTKELDALMAFFQLTQDEVRLIVSDNIGDSSSLKKHFKL